MNKRRTIVLVLRSGGDFSFRDALLLIRHINGRWVSLSRPRIILLWDKASVRYELGNFEIHPMPTVGDGVWSKMYLFSPEMDQYRPFLYVDLDTAVIRSLEHIFDLVTDPTQFITLEDFWQPGELATGLVWFPVDSPKVRAVWDNFKGARGWRMDYYIRTQIGSSDAFWQQLTKNIHDFKPRRGVHLQKLTQSTTLVCFHGKPRIYDATGIEWVKAYVNTHFTLGISKKRSVTVIIPYNRDRGWLQDAVASVPANVQLLLSQGEENWPENFNRVLPQATGNYIRWLHEDDMLTPNSIEDAIEAIESQDVDFIHGNAIEIHSNNAGNDRVYRPAVKHPTANDLKHNNVLHSATMMYRRSVFDRVGPMREGLNAAEEFEFNLRCLSKGMKIGYCDAPLAFYRRHKEQKIRTIPSDEIKKQREYIRGLH